MSKPFATLYTTPKLLHARITKTLAAAALNNLTIHIPQDFEYAVTNMSASYLAKFPHGKIPALETPSGFCLGESTAIAQYVAESGPAKEQLMGRSIEDRALVQMWISFADTELFPQAGAILTPIMGRSKYDKEVVDEKETQFKRSLRRLETHLSLPDKVWLVRDDELSMADLAVASAMYWPLMFFMDEAYRGAYPKTMEWYTSLMEVEEVGQAFGGKVVLCTEKPDMNGSLAAKLQRKLHSEDKE